MSEETANNALTYADNKTDRVVAPAQPSRVDTSHEAFRAAALVNRAAAVAERPIRYRILLSRMPVLPTRAAGHVREQIEREGIADLSDQIP
jgi:hypothetical protein